MATVTDDDQDSRIDQRYESGRGSYDSQLLADQEQAGYDREFNDIVNNSNLGDLNDTEAVAGADKSLYNPSSSYGGKKTPWGRKLTFENVRAILKKRGALGLVGVILGVVGIGGITLLSPSLLLFHMFDNMANNFNDAHATITIKSRNAIARKINSGFKPSEDGKCNVWCKRKTMSEPLVAKLKAAGYDVKSTSVGGRHTVESIKFPDGGPLVKSGADFKAAIRDPVRAAHFTRVYNAATKPFTSSRFVSAIKTKLGIDKSFKLASETREKFKAAFRKALGLPEQTGGTSTRPMTEEELRGSQRLSAFQARITKINARIAKITGAAQAGCTARNVSSGITVGLTIAQYSAAASYAMLFWSTAQKIKAGESVDPIVTSELGRIITSYATNKTNADGTPNDLYGLTATDSHGYKAAVYGDKSPLPEYAKSNRIGPQGVLGALVNPINLATKDATSRGLMKTTCMLAATPQGMVLQCTLAALAGAIIGCLAQVGAGLAAGKAIEAALPGIIKSVITSNLSTIDENTVGAAAGEVLYPGTAGIFGAQAAVTGMRAGTPDQIANYTKVAAEVQQEDTAIAKVNAKEQPFDIYNQYSFLGSLAASMNLTSFAGQPITQVASLTASLLPRSFASLTSTSHAGTYQPLPEQKAKLYSMSDDCSALTAINVASDDYCTPSYVTTPDELDLDPAADDANTHYMIDNGFVDEDTGGPKASDKGKLYQKWLDNCPFRTESLGETSAMLEDGSQNYGVFTTFDANSIVDYEMQIGGACSSEENIFKQFRMYTTGDTVNALADSMPASTKSSAQLASTANSGAGTTTANSGNVNPNGWTFPTTPGAPLVSPFGPRGGGFHTGVDLGVPSGSPFYATRDGVVQTREYNVYTVNGDGGAWCPVLGQISDPNQKDIWITHDVNGQMYTSVYAHMSQFLKQTGDVVKAGDLIGYTGGSGCSSGPHVHFEIWQGKATPSVPGPGMLDPWPLITQQ